MMKLCAYGVSGIVLVLIVSLTGSAWADPAEDAYNEGMRLAKEGLLKQAVEEFDKAIRLKPTYAEAYAARGNVRNRLVQNERAIQDFDEAVRLNPQYTEAYYNRANAFLDSGQLDKALKDYDQTLTLNPWHAEALYNRGLVHVLLARGEAAKDARSYLDIKGWKDERALYVVLIGYFGYRYGHQDDEARKLLEEARAKCDASAWPYPIVRYLLHELSTQALLNLAADNDKKTEAQAYAGMDLSLSGKREEALTHLRWVKDNGNKGFVEYAFAAAEFNRLVGP
jgi:tetratricopeptide (TPR) repeat protein